MFARLLAVLRERWLLALIGAAALSLLVWFAGPLIAVADYKPLASQTARFVTILVIFLIWGLNKLRLRAVERSASGKFTQALMSDAAPADRAGEAADAEEAILGQRLKDALSTLQKARLAKGRRLYQLPWYVIIGAPGSGKTTALKHSGLRFPLESQIGDNPVQGAGGTRYCDWWFTDQAVLLDTAGRYTVQDNPTERAGKAWLGFLALLKKSRPRRPLNGVIVTLSVLDLLTKTPTQLAMQAAAIKRRIQELNGHLGMDLPVYVLLSKCDLIAGFNEFFADLEREEREQVWGISFPLSRKDKPGAAVASFPERYRALIARANDRLLSRLQAEPDPRRRALIFGFPQQMMGLQDGLNAFLRDVFVPNQFEQPALLRGVFFISGTQAGGAAHWVSGVLPPELLGTPISAAAAGAPRSFFIFKLLREVIFAEAGLAAANRSALRRFRWVYSAALTGMVLCFSAVAAAWYVSHRNNVAYIDQVGAELGEYRDQTGGGLTPRQRDWALLATGLDRLRELTTGYADRGGHRTLTMSVGLYQGEKVGAQARQTYLKALERFFMPALTELLLRQIEAAGDNEDYLYEALRFYLMLYHPDKLDRDALAVWAGIAWQRLLPGLEQESTRAALTEHLRVALTEGVPPPPLDRQQVAQAREILVRTPLERRVYRRLKNEYLREHPGQFSVESVLGKKGEALFYRRSGKPLSEGIPTLFTYNDFHTRFSVRSRQLAKRLAEERWIYGDTLQESFSDEEVAAIVAQVEELYLKEYVTHWQALLDDLVVKSFNTTASGRTVVQLLTSADTPLLKLLKEIRRNTALSELPEQTKAVAQIAGAVADQSFANERRRLETLVPADAAGVKIRLPGQAVTDAFRGFNDYVTDEEGLPLQRLQEALTRLNEYFDTLAYADDPKRAAFEASRDPEQGSAAIRNVNIALAAAPPVVQRWFSTLTANSSRVTAAAAGQHVNDAWRAEVVAFFDKAIKGRYPLDPSATQEVRLDDFAAFFGPGGILDQYFEAYVKPFVDTGRAQWGWRKRVAMSPQTPALFQRAKRIQEAYFKGPGRPQVGFTLKPYSLHSVVTRSLLEVAGASLTYQHGPAQSTVVQWPVEGVDVARIVFNLASGGTPVSAREEGEWAWFRLLDKYGGTEPRQGGNVLLVTFEVQGVPGQYELRPQRVVNPFTHRDIRGFTLPNSL